SRRSGSPARSRTPPARRGWAARRATARSRRGWGRAVSRRVPCRRRVRPSPSGSRPPASQFGLLREQRVDLLVELRGPLLDTQLAGEDLGDHVALHLEPGLRVRGDRVRETVLLRGLGEDLQVVLRLSVDLRLLGTVVV